jgi:hypothetical protein
MYCDDNVVIEHSGQESAKGTSAVATQCCQGQEFRAGMDALLRVSTIPLISRKGKIRANNV